MKFIELYESLIIKQREELANGAEIHFSMDGSDIFIYTDDTLEKKEGKKILNVSFSTLDGGMELKDANKTNPKNINVFAGVIQLIEQRVNKNKEIGWVTFEAIQDTDSPDYEKRKKIYGLMARKASQSEYTVDGKKIKPELIKDKSGEFLLKVR